MQCCFYCQHIYISLSTVHVHLRQKYKVHNTAAKLYFFFLMLVAVSSTISLIRSCTHNNCGRIVKKILVKKHQSADSQKQKIYELNNFALGKARILLKSIFKHRLDNKVLINTEVPIITLCIFTNESLPRNIYCIVLNN
jgi:hypothetical protein